jgi:hypothetical protein
MRPWEKCCGVLKTRRRTPELSSRYCQFLGNPVLARGQHHSRPGASTRGSDRNLTTIRKSLNLNVNYNIRQDARDGTPHIGMIFRKTKRRAACAPRRLQMSFIDQPLPMIAILTGATPLAVKPMSLAAARDRSMMRPPTKGPRSLMRTSTVSPLRVLVTRTSVPNGRVL